MNHFINTVTLEDIYKIGREYHDLFDVLESKAILVTGATGLIGKALVYTLLYNTKTTKIIALVRNAEKANEIFGDSAYRDRISFLVSDIEKAVAISEKIDYIVHAASQTSSKAFVSIPVEIINVSVKGTQNILELAKQKSVQGVVYLSSMEVYGTPESDSKISEDHSTNIKTTDVRSSYSESKRMCETLCTAYASEYGVPVKILRLTQTFGPGVEYNDGRVFADFARCAIENRNIVLHTKGETRRNYLYTADAVSAILTVLIKGVNGNAYNAANESVFCSIYEMASIVADKIACKKIGVVIEETDVAKFGYAPPFKMNLDVSKLRSLGWNASYGIYEMFQRMIFSMKKS